MGTSLFHELRYKATEGSPCANGVRARPLCGCLFDSVVPSINRRVDSVNSSCARGRLPPWRMPAFSAGESDTLVETCLPVFLVARCTEGPLHSAPPPSCKRETSGGKRRTSSLRIELVAVLQPAETWNPRQAGNHLHVGRKLSA
jgi:hypothetical protein